MLGVNRDNPSFRQQFYIKNYRKLIIGFSYLIVKSSYRVMIVYSIKQETFLSVNIVFILVNSMQRFIWVFTAC